MTEVQWFAIRGKYVRLEGEQSEIDTILRSVEVADRVHDIAEYAEETDVEMEVNP